VWRIEARRGAETVTLMLAGILASVGLRPVPDDDSTFACAAQAARSEGSKA
jgi:hypothetical protein